MPLPSLPLEKMWRCGDVEMWRCGDVEIRGQLFFLTKSKILNYLNFLMVRGLKKDVK